MSAHFRTPLKTAVGLGSAKEGVSHFIKQRVSALALAVLVPWFLFSLIVGYRSGYERATDWLAQPVTSIGMLLFVTAAFYHMRLGLQVVIEDYIGGHGTRAALLVLNTFLTVVLWVASVFSILKVAFAG